jgi:hypothetical protein
MMRGITVELPEVAAKRLSELEAAKWAAEDAMRSAQGRINTLPQDARELRARLEAQRDAQADRHRVLSMLVSRCNQWHVELRLGPNSVLELAPAVEVKLKASETCAAALAGIREQIARVQGDLVAVRRAPMKRASQEEALRSHLARLASQSRPRINFDARGGASVRWIEDMATMDAVLGLLCVVLGPEAVLAGLVRDLEPEAAGALAPLEKERRVSELMLRLLELERIEEALVLRAASEGIELPRRGDASPLAVLGVVIVAKEGAERAA